MDFSGATILVTGAASGIGAETARALDAAGAQLILMDRDAAGLAAFPGARTIVGDVADADLWAGAELGGLTHAVINAGIVRGSSSIADTPLEEWHHVLSVNLDGAFLSLGAAMRAIKATGQGGAITLTASVTGMKAVANTAPYAVSKAGVIHLAKVAALEGAPDRIRVNAIAPAGVETPLWSGQAFFQDMARDMGGQEAAFRAMAAGGTPLGRFSKAEEVAGQIAFLLSDAAALVTGTCLVADGGYSL